MVPVVGSMVLSIKLNVPCDAKEPDLGVTKTDTGAAEFSRRTAFVVGRAVSGGRPNQIGYVRGDSRGHPNPGNDNQDLRWQACGDSQRRVGRPLGDGEYCI